MKKKELFKETVNRVISDLDKRLIDKHKIISEAWYKAIDENTKKHTRIESVKDKVLYIKAESPAWIYEIKRKKKDIIDKINQRHKEEVLKDVKAKLGDI